MANIALTAAQIAPVFPQKAEIYDLIAAAAITAGQIVYTTTAGKVDLADGSGAGTIVNIGVALNGAAAGEPVSVLKRGHVAGFTVSGLNGAAKAYVSNDAGSAADAAGDNSKVIGTITAIPTVGGVTKLLYVEADWV